MPSFEKASNIAAEQAELQAFLNELLTLYLRDVLSFVNTNYDIFIKHLRALGHDDPQASAKEVFQSLRAVAGVPVPEHGSEPPIIYDVCNGQHGSVIRDTGNLERLHPANPGAKGKLELYHWKNLQPGAKRAASRGKK